MKSAVLAGLVLVTQTGCANVSRLLAGALEPPTAEFSQLHLRDWSFEEVTMDFEFAVTNPNTIGLTLEGLDYELDLDGKGLFSGDTASRLRLEPSGTAPVRLPLTVRFTELADNLATLLSDRDEVPFRVAVAMQVATPGGPIRVPVEHEGQLPLPKLPEISVAGIELAALDFRGARLEVALGVENRGRFPIKPRGLSYDLAIAGLSVTRGDETLTEVAEGAQQRVVFPVQLDFLRLGAAAVEAVRTRRLPYALEGSLDLGLFEQPFTLTGVAEL